MAHNPTVKEIGSKYYIFYTGTTYSKEGKDVLNPEWCKEPRYKQRIGVAVEDHPAGPWRPSEKNPVLGPREGEWDSTFVTNPSVFEEDGKVKLIYKSRLPDREKLILGMACAADPEGPYVRCGASPLFDYNVEDPYVWKEDGKYWMIVKAMDNELVEAKSGILFVSEDGEQWTPAEHRQAWTLELPWIGEEPETVGHVERPQLLLEDGKPTCIYFAIGDFDSNQMATYSYNLAVRI